MSEAKAAAPTTPAVEQLGSLPAVLQPEEGASYWRPSPANGYVTVKSSPHYGGPDGVVMGTQAIPPGCRVPDHSHDRQIEILFCYEGKGHVVVDGTRHDFVPGTTVVARPWVKHTIVNDGDTVLRMTWTMLPPGLETFFRLMGRARNPGDPTPEPFEPPAAAHDIQRATGFGDLQKV